MTPELPRYDIVLLGVGHTNAHVLRMWRMKPLAETRLTCVSNFPVATYSGMLPGVLAGQFPRSAMEIDLVRLCAAAGARLVLGEVTGLDRQQRRLLFRDRAALRFDALSIGVGSVPRSDIPLGSDRVVVIKPMQTFLPRLEAVLQRVLSAADSPGSGPLRVAIIGGGAGGVEIAFCLPQFLAAWGGARCGAKAAGAGPRDTGRTQPAAAVTVVHAEPQLSVGATAGMARRAARALRAGGVELLLGRRVTRIDGDQVLCDDQTRLTADLIVWATGAAPPPLLGALDLPRDARGFLLTDATLRTVAGDPVFAVGDSGTIAEHPTPKAGVFAVRQGPVLWQNLQRTLQGRPLRPYRPQSGFLKLLNTGQAAAIGEYAGVSFQGRWALRLKNAIDSAFMKKYQDYQPMPMAPSRTKTAPVMRCAGCGGKVGGSVLQRVFARLQQERGMAGHLPPDQLDDAAVLAPQGGHPLTATVDFFKAPLDDPYLVGRIAALNALSDLFAMGAFGGSALAVASIPHGPSAAQEELLYQLLAGSCRELTRAGVQLVGGHTIEAAELTYGFTLLAPQVADPMLKSGLAAGDRLILTKPLGSGILLAAHMDAACRSDWMLSLLEALLQSNQAAAELARRHGVRSATDVTGFGLAGHLLEMLRASQMAAELELSALPRLPGAQALSQQGRESTLAPANRELAQPYTTPGTDVPELPLLFDPQTSGGLLLAVSPENHDGLLAELREVYPAAASIGRVVPRDAGAGAFAVQLADGLVRCAH